MKKITSVLDLFPDYLNTDALLKALDPDSYCLDENDKPLIIHFKKPNGSLLLTVDNLTKMNEPSFITYYQKDLKRRTREDILVAIKKEFGKEIISSR